MSDKRFLFDSMNIYFTNLSKRNHTTIDDAKDTDTAQELKSTQSQINAFKSTRSRRRKHKFKDIQAYSVGTTIDEAESDLSVTSLSDTDDNSDDGNSSYVIL